VGVKVGFSRQKNAVLRMCENRVLKKLFGVSERGSDKNQIKVHREETHKLYYSPGNG
jgi:hypothetical protein